MDQDYGPATEKQVKKFQEKRGLSITGEVKEDTYYSLVEPMMKGTGKGMKHAKESDPLTKRILSNWHDKV